jgi:glycosyltransferase involved in cell wall biosynthesis
MTHKRIVGVNSSNYATRRNITDLPFTKYGTRKVVDAYRLKSWLRYKVTGELLQRDLNSFFDLDLNRCDLFHFFNAVSYGRRPWIMTFETHAPRWGYISKKEIRKGIELLSGDACKRIIAFSDSTKLNQQAFLQRNAPDLRETVESKMIVLSPPQHVLVDDLSAKPDPAEKVVFTFVGGEFFRKGGQEMMEAFLHLYRTGRRNWQLNIISTLQSDYITKATHCDKEHVLGMMREMKDMIFHRSTASNQQVLELLKSSHVGLLPTLADTYGYAVLEAQATGCAVLTTDVRALPEINNDQVGWMIPLPKDEVGHAFVRDDLDRKRTRAILKEGLIAQLIEIMEYPGQILAKGENALTRIRESHTPAHNASVLERVYDESLSK